MMVRLSSGKTSFVGGGRIGRLEKELAKEHKSEKKEKRKTDKAFKELIRKISKFEKKKLLTAEDAGELVDIIERIKEEV